MINEFVVSYIRLVKTFEVDDYAYFRLIGAFWKMKMVIKMILNVMKI